MDHAVEVAQFHDALQMRNPHLDLLALTSRRLETLGVSERPGDVPGVLMDVARDLASAGERNGRPRHQQ